MVTSSLHSTSFVLPRWLDFPLSTYASSENVLWATVITCHEGLHILIYSIIRKRTRHKSYHARCVVYANIASYKFQLHKPAQLWTSQQPGRLFFRSSRGAEDPAPWTLSLHGKGKEHPINDWVINSRTRPIFWAEETVQRKFNNGSELRDPDLIVVSYIEGGYTHIHLHCRNQLYVRIYSGWIGVQICRSRA